MNKKIDIFIIAAEISGNNFIRYMEEFFGEKNSRSRLNRLNRNTNS